MLRIGVDIGGNDIKFGATNLDADQVLLPELVKRPSLAKDGPQQTIAQVLNGIQAVLAQLGAGWTDVADIAVTVPCPCTPEGLIIEATNLGTPETKRAWQVPFGEYLAAAVRQASGLEIPVFACNDANAAGQDDDFVRYGLDAGRRTSVFITTGTGLGGCIMINGSVHFGVGQAGELGHVKPALPAQYRDRFADDPNPQCGCGGYQCVEAWAALKGLIRRVTWAVTDAGAAHIEKDLASRGERLSGQVLARLRALHAESPQRAAYEVRTFADRDQDALSRWLLEDWAIMIGVLFANLAPVVHPDLFIIGGGMTEMSDAGREWFISVVRRVYSEVNAQACFMPEASKEPGSSGCEIVWSVSRDQGWRGAILMGMRARPAASI
jgi:glucokinase